MESLKAAISAAGTPSSKAELLASLSTLEEQLHAVLPESLPAVLEGKHPWEVCHQSLYFSLLLI